MSVTGDPFAAVADLLGLVTAQNADVEVPFTPIPGGPSLTIPTPTLPSVSDFVGKTSESIFAAVMGPIAELALTFIFAIAGIALISYALVRATQESKTVQKANEKVAQVAQIAAVV
jgi:hypothetical protein